MSVFCGYKIFYTPSPVSRLAQLQELFPLSQFFVLSYIWSQTVFYREYPLLMFVSMAIIFYLVNGKLVLACVTKQKMKMLHLDLLYMLLPAAVLLAEKMAWMDAKQCDKVQIILGFVLTVLYVERCVSYSISVVRQMTAFLGYGFFEMPKKKVEVVVEADTNVAKKELKDKTDKVKNNQ
eukprot:TRINITY_DN70878_c0_g1_i1.p5 TRINITY_DN70878_c0_g1~~TRINITY_DN70878_c0_g1_i1.p5  ORF type:complete len:179 (+),score=27.74 TRINITY_DN70878_c0_g1_i1:954-1490(+)